MRALSFFLLLAACSAPAATDAGVDAGSPIDAGMDVGPPGMDAGSDAGPVVVDASSMRLTGDFSHPLDSVLRLNHLQAEGTHNSYHLRPVPDPIDDWDYEHAPLGEQFELQGVRKVELDFYWDSSLQRFRVYHVPLLDERSSCERLLDCLVAIRRFSDAHPGHHPIFVQLEPKGLLGGLSISEIGDRLDAEIRAVFSEDLLITPDFVRGARATLAEAIQDPGWPTLAQVRGRTLFFLDCARDYCLEYAGAALRGRAAFVDSEIGDPFAGLAVINTPGDEVRAAVLAGFIVRTRAISMPGALHADEPTLRAELDLALSSGAHMISTDVPVPRPDVALYVEMPGGSPSRCNPLTAPPECTSLAIEDPSRIAP